MTSTSPTRVPLMATRLAIGISQGFALYGLDVYRKLLTPEAFGGLNLAAAFFPIVLLGAVGTIRGRTFWLWGAATALLTLGVGAYWAWVGQQATGWGRPGLNAAVAAVLFIGHHLIACAQAEGRWRASYERYFDEGWKDALRIVLAAMFVGAVWVALYLGAALFNLIGLKFLQELLTHKWVSMPVTATAFAIGIHVTDVRATLVQGARTLALTLLAWLLPLLTLLTGGFLLALPFTGLVTLKGMPSAAGVMLSCCAGLIILINAVYQDGERPGHPSAFFRWAARVAAVVLAPLAIVSAYGLAIRIQQHGLTPSRIYGVASVIVAACYAAGYLRAVFARDGWLRPIEGTNWVTAHVAVAILLVLFSPLGDPQRLSVNDQMARLAKGKVTAANFDWAFMRFGAGRWGTDALKALAGRRGTAGNVAIARRAAAELQRSDRYEDGAVPPSVAATLIHGVNGPLPPDFLTQTWPNMQSPAQRCYDQTGGCPAYVADLDGRPGAEIVVFTGYAGGNAEVYGKRDGRWRRTGELSRTYCSGIPEAVRAGQIRPAKPLPRTDLEINGLRFVYLEAQGCPGRPPSRD